MTYRSSRTLRDPPSTGRPMADPLLERIHSQIRARVRELEPLAREHDRLEAALTALGGPVVGRATPAAT
jgi:hypothetical protein